MVSAWPCPPPCHVVAPNCVPTCSTASSLAQVPAFSPLSHHEQIARPSTFLHTQMSPVRPAARAARSTGISPLHPPWFWCWFVRPEEKGKEQKEPG